MNIFAPKTKNIFTFFLLLFLAASCSQSSLSKINQPFEKKYGKEIKKINSQRTENKKQQNQMISSYPPTPLEVEESIASRPGYYPYVGVNRYDSDRKVALPYLPDSENYHQIISRNQSSVVPPDIFEITYRTELHPPFRRIGAEFDNIRLPDSDAYGVLTAMSEKSYLLVGGQAMKETVDSIDAERTDLDVELSEDLIKEQKQLNRKAKMEKIFGKEESFELANINKNKSEKEVFKKEQNNSVTLTNERSQKGSTALINKVLNN